MLEENDDLMFEDYCSELNEEDHKGIQVIDEVIDWKFICPTLRLSQEEEVKIYRVWKCCLIIKVLGWKFVFCLLERKLLQL